jgi:fructose 1,6-bisphosphate aldolase/phosphatase
MMCVSKAESAPGPLRPALGFQLADGKPLGHARCSMNPSFDRARGEANRATDYFRKHGPFEPHRLALEEMGHMMMPSIAAKLEFRWALFDSHTPERVRRQ